MSATFIFSIVLFFGLLILFGSLFAVTTVNINSVNGTSGNITYIPVGNINGINVPTCKIGDIPGFSLVVDGIKCLVGYFALLFNLATFDPGIWWLVPVAVAIGATLLFIVSKLIAEALP